MTPRYGHVDCPVCGVRVGTYDGKVNPHGHTPPRGRQVTCRGSGVRA